MHRLFASGTLVSSVLVVAAAWLAVPGTVARAQPAVEPLLRLAEERYLAGDLEAAAGLYAAAAAATTHAPAAARHLITAAWLEAERGETGRAEALVDDALARDPELVFQAEVYTQNFVDLFARRRQNVVSARTEQARGHVREGIAALSSRRFDDARRAFEAALVISPDDPSALFNLALVELESGNTSGAIAGFDRILSLSATKPALVSPDLKARCHASLANAYFRSGSWDDAESAARAALAVDPRLAVAWELLGLVQKHQGQLGEAAVSFREALAITPDDARLVGNLAAVAIARGEWIEAVALLADAARKNPNDPNLWLNLGIAQRGMANFDGARTSLGRAIATAGTNDALRARAAATLALVELDGGRGREAEGAAREAVRLDASNLDGRMALGAALLRLGRAADAVAAYEVARSLDPTRADVARELGVALVAAGRRQEAADAFRAALALRPDDAEAQAYLAATLGGRQISVDAGQRQAPVAAKPKPTSGLEFEAIDYLRGALVKNVVAGSAGEKAGLLRGDLVVAADGKPIDKPAELERALGVAIPGLPIRLDIVRDGVRRTTSIVF